MALTVESVGKRYGATMALRDVSAEFQPGEIHAVLGENGAGKSTLMGIMAGFVTPDSGSLSLQGTPLPLGRPFEARKRGIGMIHQHFTLVPALTVQENLALAQLPSLFCPLRLDELAEPSLQAAKRLGWKLDPNQPVRQLSVGQRQRLEILKALGGHADVLIFDEPTAMLTADEVEELFTAMRQLRDEGRVIILIAHKLAEVTTIADRVTVLRRGEKVASCAIGETDAVQLARWMVGDEFDLLDSPARLEERAGEIAISLRDVRVRSDRGEEAVRGVSLVVRAGEIVAIGGVDGNGQAELAEAMAGVRPLASGALQASGVGYIPQDRQGDGLALGMSIVDNLLVTGHRQPVLAPGGWLKGKRIAAWAKALMERFDVRAKAPKVKVGGLSGGNQQKVVVARALSERPEALVAVNPTRGLDLKASKFVHAQIVKAKEEGTAVALFSTDADELKALGDRIVYLSRGELAERPV